MMQRQRRKDNDGAFSREEAGRIVQIVLYIGLLINHLSIEKSMSLTNQSVKETSEGMSTISILDLTFTSPSVLSLLNPRGSK